MTMNDSELSSSSFLNCFASEPDPIAWSFVFQTLTPVFNIKGATVLANEQPKPNISDLESILKDAKLLAIFLKGNTADDCPGPTNDCRSNNIELSDDYAEDEIDLLKVVSTCLVPGNNKGPVAEKGDAVLQEGPSLSEKGDAVLQEGPSLSEKGDAVLQEGVLVPGYDSSILQDVHVVPTNNNDILQKASPVTKSDMQEGSPINENSNEIMQKGYPIDGNGNLNMPKGHPGTVNSVQNMPLFQQMNESGDTNMPKAHPDNNIMQEGFSIDENSNEIIQKGCPIDENGNPNMSKDHLVMENSVQIMPVDQQTSENGDKNMPKAHHDNEIMQEGYPIDENSNEVMQKGCPIDENGNPNMLKGHPVTESSAQIMPEGQQVNENGGSYMPEAHPVTENGAEGIPERHIIAEKGDETMHGLSATGNVQKMQTPQALENDDNKLPSHYCLKCHRAGSLIMCEVENCSTSFHERCVAYLERNETGTFKCPLCFYKHTAMAYHKAKERYSQAKKSLAIFLLKDTVDDRFGKRKSSKLNDDMNTSGSKRKRKKRTEVQVKVESLETEMHRNGSEANSVQQQVIDGNTVNLNRGNIKVEVDAARLINGTHDKGATSKIRSKETLQEVLNMPAQRARVGTIHNDIGRSPHISK